MTAFVVVELPMTMLVKLARVAIRDEKNPLVVVLLVTTKDEADKRPLTDADVEYKLVAVSAVADADERFV